MFEALPRGRISDKSVEIYHDRCFRALAEGGHEAGVGEGRDGLEFSHLEPV